METHKQAATEGDCSKNLAEHLKGGNACMYVCMHACMSHMFISMCVQCQVHSKTRLCLILPCLVHQVSSLCFVVIQVLLEVVIHRSRVVLQKQ